VLITVDEAAKVLGLTSKGDLYRKVREGRLPGAAQYPKSNGMLRWMVERDGIEEAWARTNRRKARKPEPGAPAPAAPPPLPPRLPATDAQVPDYNESRARHEFEKANLAELERKRREGELIEREAVGRSLARLMGILRGGLLGLPSTLRDRIPHLSPEDVDTTEQLIRQQLEELAAGIESDGLPVVGDD
jgi:hypothetical protein